MNDLFFPSQLKLVNLTPFKFSLCSLISIFIKDETMKTKYSNLIIFDIIKQMMSEYKCEISKQIFYSKLSETIKKVEKENDSINFSKEEIEADIITKLEESYFQIKTMNDLYNFFNCQIKDLKSRNEEGLIFLENGGIIEHFIRKCLFAFYKMSFEEIIQLYENINLYIKEERINIYLTNKESELLLERQLRDLDRKGKEELNEEFLESLNYKHKFFILAKLDENKENSLSNIYKFFDYNMKNFYLDGSNQNKKIHYCLLNIVEYYFNEGYYEHAIQIVFECIKLSQSSCDQEGLLKCFIWMEKIYKYLGKFDMAAKSISTSLIKSYENNFYFLFLISSTELAFLNYHFHSNIGDYEINRLSQNHQNSINKKSTNLSYEDKILSYSNSIFQSYKNILQLLSSNKSDYVYDKNPQYYFKNVYIILILNLLRKGYSSLAKSFIKKLIDYLFLNKEMSEYNFSPDNPNCTIETLKIIFNLLFETMEYDLSYTIDLMWKIYIVNKNLKLEKLFEIIKLKFLSLSGRLDISDLNFNNKSNEQSYDYVCKKYLYFQSFILNLNSSKDKVRLQEIEIEIMNFRNYCKVNKFQKFKLQTDLLISSILIKQGNNTNALFNVNKIIEKCNDEQTFIKAKLLLAEIYAKLKDKEMVKIILNQIKRSVDNYGAVTDKFKFYFLKAQIILCDDKINQSINDYIFKNTISKCIEYSVMTNNLQFMNNTIYLLKLINPDSDNISVFNDHIKMNSKLLYIFPKFSLTFPEQIELIRIIDKNNFKFLDKIKLY